MGDADFKFVFACAFIFILFGIFNMALASDRIDTQNKLTGAHEDTGFWASLTASVDFLSPFSDSFQSDMFIVDAFFSVLLFALVVVGVRTVRGV